MKHLFNIGNGFDLAKSINAKMRLTEKYSETRTLIDSERQGSIDVLNRHDTLEKTIKLTTDVNN